LIKNLYECKGYKLQRSAVYKKVSEQSLDEEQHQQEQSTGVRAAAVAVYILMKTRDS